MNSAATEVEIRLAPSKHPHVEIVGLSAKSLATLSHAQFDRAAWQRVFALHVVSNRAPSTTPVLGEYKVLSDRVQFTPQFPFRPGLSYSAVLNLAAIPGEQSSAGLVEATLSIPAPPPAPPTVVESLYPSSDVLPENLLKFYVHFSAPMSRGGSYHHIRLSDANGILVEAPFLELAEELWDESGKRLTLLLDPGRVKQDLTPHKEVGRALTDGQNYVLAIAVDWRDAEGNPLGSEFRKPFRVAAPDVRQPAPQRWQLAVPKEGTQGPLTVEFEEPLDHAMLQHVIRVTDSADVVLEGSISIEEQETRWSFRPAAPWRAGDHRLLIDAALEDRAGNSIERQFEVYLPAGRPTEVTQYVLPFVIGNARAPIRAPAK